MSDTFWIRLLDDLAAASGEYANRDERIGTQLTPFQQRALNAVISCPTMEKAAEQADIGRTTLYDLLKDPVFVAALREAQQELSRGARVALQMGMLKAISKLGELLDSQNETVAHKAAVSLLDHGLKVVEVQHLEEGGVLELLRGVF